MTAQPLRIAIALQGPEQPPPWCMRLVQQICAEPNFALCALLKPKPVQSGRQGSSLIRGWNLFERKLAARPQPANSELYEAATHKLPVLSGEDEAAIGQLELDVILDLSGDFGSQYQPALARHGVWFFDFLCREPGFAGMPPIVSDLPTTDISLFRRVADQAGCVGICKAALNTKYIATRNELFMCEKAVPLALRELRRTWLKGTPAVQGDLAFSIPQGAEYSRFHQISVRPGQGKRGKADRQIP